MPGRLPLRNLHFSLVDVPDLQVLPPEHPTMTDIWMGAGPVPEVLHRVLNLLANLLLVPHVSWALIPIAVFAFGWALMVPVVTLLVLDLHPERRGMASSLQACIGSAANGLVAGVIVPLVMHSTRLLAATSLAMMAVGLVAWVLLRRRWPDTGQHITAH